VARCEADLEGFAHDLRDMVGGNAAPDDGDRRAE
jgi:hypothetical protein